MPELTHGKLVTLAPNAHRITAPNAGVMTGEGTNTYLFGRRDIAVVDPGPALDVHVEAILAGAAQLGGQIRRIFVTHTHMDHSPACHALVARTGAELVGMSSADDQFQDTAFTPDISCVHEQKFVTDEYELLAIHTPGHVSNHFCYLEKTSGLLMTGDHIMNGSTVVIVPPSGDMAAYIESLQLLLAYPVRLLAPGHGDLMEDAAAVVEWLVSHRLGREQKVVDALREHGSDVLHELVIHAYDDVDDALHPIACYSLWAHLIKLEQEGRASESEGVWSLVV
ncbi:MAG: MBL fold metallo-hydrolase [Pseudomonadales bacterium]